MTVSKIFRVKPLWLSKFRIARVERSPISGQPGATGSELPTIESALVEELLLRRDLKAAGRRALDGLSPNDWLKEALYQLVLIWRFSDHWEELIDRIENSGRLARGTRKEERDIFEVGVVGFLLKNATIIPVPRRKRFTRPMWYGFRHYIPPPLLNAFNAEYPRHKARREEWRDHIEPALEGWVKEQRIYSMARECPLDEERGKYSPEVERAVKGALATAETSIDHDW